MEIVTVFDTVVGVHVYISDNFIPQWHQHSDPWIPSKLKVRWNGGEENLMR